MAMNLERNIEDALISQILSRTYISTNEIPVRRYDDLSSEDGEGVCVVVKAMPNERVQPNYPKWKIPVAVMCKGYTEEDMQGDAMQALYQDICQYVQEDLTVANLNTTITESKLTVDGLVPQPAEFQREDVYTVLAGVTWIYVDWH